MFADVVGSMDIARSVGAERLGEIMVELVRRATHVVRNHGGLVNQFTGDGLMAVFGAPNALEGHALLACISALGILDEAREVAAEAAQRDGVELHLRIGLNSGQVVTGPIDSGALGYTMIGEHVGFAQRMESVAPPDGVMLSEATARLVQQYAILGAPESVSVKGRSAPVPVRRLLAVRADHAAHRDRREPALVGRSRELNAIAALLDAPADDGAVVRVIGPAGVGKTRMVDEVIALTAVRATPVYSTYCESHTREVSYSAAARLLRALFAVSASEPEIARAQLRSQLTRAEHADLLILDDLLGISEAAIGVPDIAPDARRRRVISLMRSGIQARATSAVFVIEDAHWIDEASESLFVELADELRGTQSLILFTQRPDYSGALAQIPDIQSIALAPLTNQQTTALATELLGPDPSVLPLARQIADTAAGNPYFATEIVRDLAERGILAGQRGHYRCHADVTEITVPATLHSTIAARIDRLEPTAKSVLYAGAVIGLHFDDDVLENVLNRADMVSTAIADLCTAELVMPRSSSGYAFRHPLVQKVAYESQLKSSRAQMHRQVALAIENADSSSAEQNAALIATHLQAAGELRAAFDWHMRAGRWFSPRDRYAAWTSWQQARAVATRLPAGDPERDERLTTVLTRLCGEVWRTGGDLREAGLDELRKLCRESGDERSLAIGTAGMIMALTGQHRHREVADLIPELLELIRSTGDPSIACALLLAVTYAKSEVGELREALRLAQDVIDLTGGELAKGGILFGSPLASATRMRGLYRLCLGVEGWRADGDAAIELARSLDPTSRVAAILYKYILSVPVGARKVDAVAMQESADALLIAEQTGDEHTLTLARIVRGLVLVYGDMVDNSGGTEGIDVLRMALETTTRRGFTLNATALIEPALARHMARHGDINGAIELARRAITHMSDHGEVLSQGVATTVLVESLLMRGGTDDRAAATTAVDHLASIQTDDGFVLNTVPELHCRALIAESLGDTATAQTFRQRHLEAALAAGFDPPND
jgi:class 3 adenylate cyclase